MKVKTHGFDDEEIGEGSYHLEYSIGVVGQGFVLERAGYPSVETGLRGLVP